jgi:hypothetical protein
MNQELISAVRDRILNAYMQNDWNQKGNLIEVMKIHDFKELVLEKCNEIAPHLKNFFNNDVFIKLTRESFEAAYLRASRNIESTVLVTISESKEIVRPGLVRWLTQEKIINLGWDRIIDYRKDTYRTRYFEYLILKGWNNDVLKDVENSSLKIIKNIGNPKDNNPFFVRGMVLGSVQSGKTTNFNAVINSSIDLGYQLIIVFSGISEDLRRQTYSRIQDDVVGGWQQGGNFRGVSNVHNFGPNEKQVNIITGPEKDFNATIAATNFNPNSYNIAICKKNVSVIKNLLLWLEKYPQARNLSALIIDDEADNASLNNNGNNPETDPSKINAGIRALLNMFNKKTYLGYTATPFANILQFSGVETLFKYKKRENGVNVDSSFDCTTEDLFPEDFIELLSPPSNYVGIKDFFDTKDSTKEPLEGIIEIIPITDVFECFPLRVIEGNGNITGTDSIEGSRASKKTDPFPGYLPNSLKDAIKCFILSIAVRDSRKQEQLNFPLHHKHHSMLVHISRFTPWIDKTQKLIEEYIKGLEPEIRNLKINSPLYNDLRAIFNNYFLPQINNINIQLNSTDRNDPYLTHRDFDMVYDSLSGAIQNINTVAIHSNSDDELKYNNTLGNKYIAIGGNSLSRGFTLEGLTINYFIRGTSTADTLMQMGRWFGYRPGYLDCCKLFTTNESIRKFDEASLIIEDLENKVDEMISERKSPREFTIWIKNNPDVIKLTRQNFLRNLHQITLDFNDKLQQSSQFLIDKDKINNYYNNFKKFIRNTNTDWKQKGTFIIKSDMDANTILNLLNITGLKEVLINLNLIGLNNYIETANKMGLLNNWTIAISFTQNTKNQEFNIEEEFGIPLFNQAKLVQRSRANDKRAITNLLNDKIFKARNSTIISPSDLGIGLDDTIKVEIESAYRQANPDKSTIPEYVYRQAMSENNGLIIFYMLDPKFILDCDDLDYADQFTDFLSTNDLTDFKTPIVGCAIGLPKITSIETSNYVTRNLIKMPSEMSFNELIKEAEDIGDKIKNTKSQDELLSLINELGIEIKLDDEISLIENKRNVLINYLENGKN